MDGRWARPVLAVTVLAMLAACGTASGSAGPHSGPSTPSAATAVGGSPSVPPTSSEQGGQSVEVAVASSSVAYLYTWTGSQPAHLRVTTDAGLHFQEVSLPSGVPDARAPQLVFPTPTDGYAVVGDPWAGPSQLQATVDGARTWRPVELPSGAGTVVSLAGHGSRVYAVTVHCTSSSHCGGVRVWSAGSGSAQFAEVRGAVPDREAASGVGLAAWEDSVWVLLGIGQTTDPITLRSSDAGATFTTRPGPGGVGCGPTATSRQVVWLSCSTGMAMAFQRARLDDPGVGLGVGGAGTGGTFLAPVSDQVALFGTGLGEDAGLSVTDDGGRSFRKVSTGPPGYAGLTTPYTFSFLTSRIGLAAGDDGSLYRTADGGATWQPLHPPHSAPPGSGPPGAGTSAG